MTVSMSKWLKFRRRCTLVFSGMGIALASSSLVAEALLVRAQTLFTASDRGVMRDAELLIRDGRIAAIGQRDELDVPEIVRILQAHTVIPGLIDARTTDGLSGFYNITADQDETSAVNMAALRAFDSFNPRDPMLAEVRRFGVTSLLASPGDLTPIAGQASVLKTAGNTVEDALLVPAAALVFNLGEGVKDSFGGRQKMPSTRMATAAVIRQALLNARAYAADKKRQSDVDLVNEALASVLEGDMAALFVAHREDDIATAIRIAREFDLRLWLHYATEGYLMREQIKQSGARVLVGPAMQRLDAIETVNASLEKCRTFVQSRDTGGVFHRARSLCAQVTCSVV